MQMSNICVITLSDSESEDELTSSREETSIVDLDVSETRYDKSDSEIPIITLDDSTPVTDSGRKVSFKIDRMPDFIPLAVGSRSRTRKHTKKKKNGFTNKKTPFITNTEPPKKKRKQEKSPTNENNENRKKEWPCTRTIQLSHSNILCTNPCPSTGLRPIIIDGCNVACGFGNGNFRVEGIIHVIQYFLSRHHEEIVCFIPQNYRMKLANTDKKEIIKDYEKRNIIVYTPSRWLNGRQITPYDDRFILQYASERQGVIISNDGYRDLFNEEPSWQDTIEKRIINFTFARGLFMLPKDPLGRDGPTLDEVLRFP